MPMANAQNRVTVASKSNAIDTWYFFILGFLI
jgi:hypothetical protein